MVKKINIAFTYCQQKLTEKHFKNITEFRIYTVCFKSYEICLQNGKKTNIAFTYYQQKLAEKNETFALNKESNTHK